MGRERSFGAFFKERRIVLGKTLRAFCADNGFDPGNLSKLERGRLPVPQSTEVLERYAKALGLKRGGDDWYTFFDLAAAEAGRIPPEILSDEEMLDKLPILFRTLRGQKIPEAKLRKLLDILRRA